MDDASKYNKLFDSLDDMITIYPNNSSLVKSFTKLKKYYELTNNCPANFISTILCTKYKLNYFVDNESRVRANQELVILYLLCIFSYIFHLFFQ